MRVLLGVLCLAVILPGCGPAPGSEEGAADFDKKREQAAKEMKDYKPPTTEDEAAAKADGRM